MQAQRQLPFVFPLCVKSGQPIPPGTNRRKTRPANVAASAPQSRACLLRHIEARQAMPPLTPDQLVIELARLLAPIGSLDRKSVGLSRATSLLKVLDKVISRRQSNRQE